jgi:hypothetical protein
MQQYKCTRVDFRGWVERNFHNTDVTIVVLVISQNEDKFEYLPYNRIYISTVRYIRYR